MINGALKQMVKYLHFIWLLLIIPIIGCSYNESDQAILNDTAYKQFNVTSEAIYNHLSNTYSDVNLSEPVITAYPSRDEWISDNTDAIGDNIDSPKKVDLYILTHELSAVTKVSLAYSNQLNQKEFLSVNRIDTFSENFIDSENQEDYLPKIYMGSFTDENILIEVLTFSTEYNYENVEEYELKLIELNKDIITEIQRKLLELD